MAGSKPVPDSIGERFSLLILSAIMLPVYVFLYIESQQSFPVLEYLTIVYVSSAIPMLLASYFALGCLTWGILMALKIVEV